MKEVAFKIEPKHFPPAGAAQGEFRSLMNKMIAILMGFLSLLASPRADV